MKSLRPLLFVGLFAALALGLATGCPIQTSQGKQMEADQAAMQARLNALEQKHESLETRFNDSAKLAGEAVLGFDQLQQELAILQGRFDELTHNKDLSPEQVTLLRRQVARQFQAIDGRLAALEEKNRITEVDKGNLDLFTGAVAAVPGQPTEEDLFREGLGNYNRGNLEAAKASFRQFLDLYGKSAKAHEAHFYLAESLFKQRAWEEAILEFDTMISRYPKSPRVPTAYLHTAIAFLEKGHKNDAKLYFEKVVNSFPKTPEAQIAKKKLSQM